MELLFEVLTRITLPIVAVAGLGYLLQLRMHFDVLSINRLLLYATLPCFLVLTLARAEASAEEVQWTLGFTTVQFVLLLALGWWTAAAMGASRDVKAVIALACAFPNSGNFAIPLVELAFGREYVVHQALITSIHTVYILIAAPLLFAGAKGGLTSHLSAAFKTPLIPAMVVGLLLNVTGWQIPFTLERPMQVLGDGYLGIALFGLGLQLASSRIRSQSLEMSVAVALRLLIAPALSALVLWPLPMDPTLKAVLFVGTCAPVGVLLTIFAAEFRGNTQLSASTVVISTLLSPLIITVAVMLTRI